MALKNIQKSSTLTAANRLETCKEYQLRSERGIAKRKQTLANVGRNAKESHFKRKTLMKVHDNYNELLYML